MANMTKSELVKNVKGIITRCEYELGVILSWDFLTKEERESFSKMREKCSLDKANLEKSGESLEESVLTSTWNYYYNNVYAKLTGFQKAKEATKAPVVPKEATKAPVVVKPVKKEQPTATAVKVAEVKKPENQTETEKNATKKGKNWWKYLLTALGSAGVAIAIMMILKGGVKDIDKGLSVEGAPKMPATQNEMVLTEEELTSLRGIDAFDMSQVNIEDYNQLLAAATEIQKVLPEDQKLPLEQIMYSIVFANLDQLEDEKQGAIFREAEEVYAATYNIGLMLDNLDINADDLIKGEHPMLTEQELLSCLVNVTDLKLTVDKFENAKTENGYDLYKVLEICGAGMDIQNDDKLAFCYAATMNDLVAQITRNFTMPGSAKETDWSYLYTTLGIYNANRDRIVELTCGHALSTIYGTGIRNDGTYGDICAEELVSASAIYHEGGAYTGPGKVKLYVDDQGYEWPEGYVYEKDGAYYTDFITDRDENGNVLKVETIPVRYSREVDPSAFLARDGDYMDAICDVNNKGIGR